MALFFRRTLTVISLLFYWPAIFTLTHIPVHRLFFNVKITVSDKLFHYLAYFILVFLLWFAISPNSKVSWRRANVWLVLFVIVWYGVVDEWLQGFVGRNPDVADFFADLAGTVAGLILLTIFSFWSAALVVTGVTIFVLTNLMHAYLEEQLPLTCGIFYLFAYGFFTVLWIRYIYHYLPIKAPEPKWLIGASGLPVIFLLTTELFFLIAGDAGRILNAVVSLVGVAVVVIVVYLRALVVEKCA